MPVNNVPLTKRMLINQANTRIVAYVSVAAFILIFSLVATKTLVSQAAYQNRVIGAKRDAVKQLKADIEATNDLKNAYEGFTNTAQNVIGGSTTGSGPQDGNNAKIVLDALPSAYDFPGLTTSLETLVTSQGVKISSITGTDDEVAQSANKASASPQPVPMPFSIGVTGDYVGVQKVINAFRVSIRPMKIQAIDITAGSSDDLTMTINAETYYQPAKSLNIRTKVVK